MLRAREDSDDEELRPPLARRPRRDEHNDELHGGGALDGGHQLEDPSFAQAERVVAMWRARLQVDVEVICEGRRFPAHRLVLASGSDMLAAAFAPEWRAAGGELRPLELHDVPVDGFERALEFLYTGSCPVSEATLTPTLDAASRLQIWPLLRLGEAFLLERLDAENCVDAMLLAEGLQLKELKAAAKAKILTDFERASASTGFLSLDETRCVRSLFLLASRLFLFRPGS